MNTKIEIAKPGVVIFSDKDLAKYRQTFQLCSDILNGSRTPAKDSPIVFTLVNLSRELLEKLERVMHA